MELSVAVMLIEKGISKSATPQHWVDLGAGDGFFTRALGSCLGPGSSINAVDQNVNSLKRIQWNLKDIALHIQAGNFTSSAWGENLDGILMANALHYVQDQLEFLKKVKSRLSPSGRVLIVEYERRQSNQWVPHPVQFAKLKDIGAKAGFSSIGKLEEAPSAYDNVSIYSAVIAI